MALKSNDARWGAGAQFLHWLMALLIIGLSAVGWRMTALPNSPDKIKIYAFHKSVGLTLLVLVVLRLIWRVIDRRPSDPAAMPPWQVNAARFVHALLYVVMLAMPLSGWLFNSAANFPLQWFGLFSVPSLTHGADLALKGFARAAHYWFFWVLAAAFTAHVAAALKHHFVDRDEVLVRMLPWRNPRLSSVVTDQRKDGKAKAVLNESSES